MARRPVNRGQKGVSAVQARPSRRLNARDAYSTMPATDATRMDNWFSTTSYVEMRPGRTRMFSGLAESGVVDTFMTFQAGGQTRFLAAVGTEIWRLDSSPPCADRDRTAPAGNMNFNANLVAVNGSESIAYDGTTLSSNTITGPTSPIGIMAFHSRIYLYR